MGLLPNILCGMGKPIGVSDYRLTSRLPEGLSGQLPKSAGIGWGPGGGESEVGDEKGNGMMGGDEYEIIGAAGCCEAGMWKRLGAGYGNLVK